MKTLLAIVAACALVAPLGCSRTCEDTDVVSDTSSATYSSKGSLFAASGDGGADAGAASSGSVMGLAPTAESATTIQLVGYFGSNGSLTITVPNVPSSGSAALDATSQACFGGPCAPLTGTIDVTRFSTQCESGICALDIVATLKGTATVPDGGTFTIEASLNHTETLGSYACGGLTMAE